MENKIKVLVYKDEEEVLRPFAGIWTREGRLARYVQPDIDKFMKKMKGKGKVVKAEIVEVEK